MLSSSSIMTVPAPGLPASLGKYRVLGLLGEGSMGMVFLAHDPVLERNVAVKVMSRSSLGDSRLRYRFEREAKAVARLHHPNIVTVHDLGYDDKGSPFIAMELLEGADLHDLLETRALRLEEKLEIVMQVCRGLQHAHGTGIVHRDIKPANIFVTHEGAAKIMDFGVSRWMRTTETQAGLVVGTAGYISPEQLRGNPVDERADLFSLGVVLFEILTGEVLFGGDTIEVIFFKTLVREAPVLVSPQGEQIPALQSILRKALAKGADARYRTAQEMGDDLRAFAKAHRGLLGESARFSTRERNPRSSGARAASSKGPTRVLLPSRATMTISPSARMRPSGRRPASKPRSRSRRAPMLLSAAVVLAGVAAATFYSTRVVTPTEPDPVPLTQSVSLLADSALALGRGDLREAAELIERGERADPQNPRWGELREQLRAKEAEAESRRLATKLVGEGRRSLEARDPSKALRAFTHAVEADPANEEARQGLDRALTLSKKPAAPPREIEAPPPPPPSPPREFVESRTEFIAGVSSETDLLGFEAEPEIEVGETTDPFFPAQIVLELSPRDARPGQPYTLAVSLYNEGYRAIEVRSLELVSRFGDKTSGKGQPIPLPATQVPPQSTIRLHEVSGTWREAFHQGEVQATITLATGGKLIKSLRW